jgi:hypothetical protein
MIGRGNDRLKKIIDNPHHFSQGRYNLQFGYDLLFLVSTKSSLKSIRKKWICAVLGHNTNPFFSTFFVLVDANVFPAGLEVKDPANQGAG